MISRCVKKAVVHIAELIELMSCPCPDETECLKISLILFKREVCFQSFTIHMVSRVISSVVRA